MKKLKSIPVYFFILLINSLFIVSCTEDKIIIPTDQAYQFDSARYNWSVDTISGYYSPISLSSIDTNDIYFLDIYSSLIHYDGKSLTAQLLPFATLGLAVKAYSDKVFIGGSYLNSLNYDKPALLVKEGIEFHQIEIPDSNQTYKIISIERTNDNVLWLGTNKGKLIKYETGSFQYYQFDTIYYVRAYKDNSNNIFLINSREILDSVGNGGKKYLEIYKYNGNDFVNVYSEFFEKIDDFTFYPSVFGGEIYAKNSYSILKFNGTYFVKIVDFPGIGVYEGFSGESENELLIQGVFLPANNNDANLFNWNGFKWSNEFQITLNGIFGRSEKLKDKYIFIGPNDPIETYLIIGSPKIK